MHIKFYLIFTALCTSTYLPASQVVLKEKAPIKQATWLELDMIYDAKEGDLTEQKLQSYLNRRADINAQNDLGNTALMSAAQRGKKRAMQLLIDAGADLNLQNLHGWTALRLAAGNGPVMQLLIDAKADLNVQDEHGETVLLTLADCGSKIVKLLIDAKADLNVQNYEGKTALMRAAGNGNNYAIKLLVAAGAKLNIEDRFGNTALMLAARKGATRAVQLLIAAKVGLYAQNFKAGLYKAGLDVQNHDGKTALMLAAGEGHNDTVQLLISSGAASDIRNEKDAGKTARDYAKDKDAFDKAVAAGMGYTHGKSPTDLPANEAEKSTNQKNQPLQKSEEEDVIVCPTFHPNLNQL